MAAFEGAGVGLINSELVSEDQTISTTVTAQAVARAETVDAVVHAGPELALEAGPS